MVQQSGQRRASHYPPMPSRSAIVFSSRLKPNPTPAQPYVAKAGISKRCIPLHCSAVRHLASRSHASPSFSRFTIKAGTLYCDHEQDPAQVLEDMQRQEFLELLYQHKAERRVVYEALQRVG